tara:strand:- start:335 stop:655 length:321 start_codon:yes stop_codon:yes gene_type:complete
MIPFIRSINELMVITQPRHQYNKIKENDEYYIYREDSGQRKRYLSYKNKEGINLPDLPKTTRRKWMKSKKAVSKFLDELDYNNQIQSTYDLTLIGRQKNHENHDAA